MPSPVRGEDAGLSSDQLVRRHAKPVDGSRVDDVRVIVRGREPDDVGACVAILATTHALDGYPMRWPADATAWLSPAGLLNAWVAVAGHDQIIGHVIVVAGHERDGLARQTLRPAAELVSVARLFVAPTARGAGAGAALLHAAAGWAAERRLRATLDVVEDAVGAIGLYEASGWQPIGRRQANWSTASGDPVWLRSYLAPA